MENFETYALSRIKDEGDPYSGILMNMIPNEFQHAACGTEFADLMNIMEGTEMLTKDEVILGTYPADVYACKKALKTFFDHDFSNEKMSKLLELLRKNKADRARVKDSSLADIAEFTLFLPARVIIYLTTEMKKTSFWRTWKKLRNEVYHDEVMKKYISEKLEAKRQELIEKPIPPVRTSEFLRQDGWFTFHDTPKELKGKPNYYISDDDRLYWWDGSDEVIISKETDQWLRKLAGQHKEIVDHIDKTYADQDFMKHFISLITDIDQFYKRIFLFQNMFYEFIQNSEKKEYCAVQISDKRSPFPASAV